MAEVITFGCKLNLYESGIIKSNALKAGFGNNTFIFNTCTVTQAAENEAFRKIKKLKRENPDAKIIVTGCAAQINPEKFASLSEVDAVIGNKEKIEESSYLLLKDNIMKGKGFTGAQNSLYKRTRQEDIIFFKERGGLEIMSFQPPSEKILVNDIMSIEETASHFVQTPFIDMEERSRAFLQIQNGCNHRCTFCIIPFARGNSRSIPFGILNKEVSELIQKGYKEIVLTGVDITDYGKDLPGGLTLAKMAKRLLTLNPNLSRLRFSSIDVAEVEDDIYELIKEPRFMPYFHISLQSGDNLILKRMKRRHTREDVLSFVKKVKIIRPESAFGADIIAGFPTETEENFENSRKLIQEAELSFCHIFSFSPHNGTPAAKMPPVKNETIKKRTSILISEGRKQLQRTMLSMIEKSYPILIEGNGNVRCENFIPGILLDSNVSRETNSKDSIKKGDIIIAYAKEIQNEKLLFTLY